MANTASSVMTIAAKELGYSRWNDPQKGTKYGRWYAKYTGNSYYGESGVPFCAMFVSWVFNQAGAKAAGIPGAYCPYIVNAGRKAGATIATKNAKYGDIVLFDWGGDGVSDHVGLVEANNGSYLTCIEGNTNNGQVARRTRAYSTVICIIRPNYSSSSNTSKTPSSSTKKNTTTSTKMGIDGKWGKKTTTALQKVLGTPQDGIVSNQYAIYRKSNPGLLSQSWQWVVYPKKSGSAVIKAMQKKLGVTVDGFMGPATIKALQRRMGTPVDGRISNPSLCVKELQKRLNNGKF